MSNVIELKNYDQQEDLINDYDKVIIFYGTRSCSYCQIIGPCFSDLSKDDDIKNVKFAKVDVSRVKCENISGVPVFVLYHKQKSFDIIMGAQQEQLENTIKKLDSL